VIRTLVPARPPSYDRTTVKASLVTHSRTTQPPVSTGATTSLTLGTRGSALALHQARDVAGLLATAHPGIEVAIRVVSSEGDIDKTSPLTTIGGRGVFTSSLQRALNAGEIDLAVHSSKDVPSISATGLVLAAFPQREDPRDVVVSRHGAGLADLPPNPVIGTSSRRRAVQVLALRPDATIADLRGNIDTRLRKAEGDQYDAVILAAAGLSRMGWTDRATELLPVDRFTPAPGQGALAVETREGGDAHALIAAIDEPRIRQAMEVERAFLRGIGGGCTTPLGAHATMETLHGQVVVRFFGMLARDDGEGLTRAYEEWPVDVAATAAFELAKAMVADVGPNRVLGAGLERGRQLHGMRVLVTGTDELVAGASGEVARRGGEPVAVPTIRISPPEDAEALAAVAAMLERGDADRVVFTSSQGVAALETALTRMPLRSVAVAAIGEATASRLRDLGVEPDLVAARSQAEGLLAELRDRVAPGERVVLPVSSRARSVLADGLHALGVEVIRVDAYATEIITEPDPGTEALIADGAIGAVLLASPSAVEGFVRQYGTLLPAMSGATFVAIGPVTASAMRSHGLPVHAVAPRPAAAGMVEALADYLWGNDRRGKGESK
jgi:hydroxymethylbilane synthase